MNTLPNQVKAAQNVQATAMAAMLNVAFTGAEKLAALNLSATRAVLDDSVESAKALLALKDFTQLATGKGVVGQPSVDRAVAYAGRVQEIMTQTQTELSTIVETLVADMNKASVVALDEATKGAPAGADLFLSSVKSSMAAANAAFDKLGEVSKQVKDIAEANVAAGRKAVVKSIAKATKKAA